MVSGRGKGPIGGISQKGRYATQEEIEAAIPNPKWRYLIYNMMCGIVELPAVSAVLGGVNDKIERLIIDYPVEVFRVLCADDPEAVDRLKDRDCWCRAYEKNGEDYVVIAWTISEAAELAKVWKDDSDKPSEITLSFLYQSPTGLSFGHMRRF